MGKRRGEILMKVISIIPCEAANVMPDGRFNLLGGGIRNVYAPQYPVVIRMSVVIQIMAEALEANQPHRVSIRLVDDDGKDLIPRLNADLNFQGSRRDSSILLDLGSLRLEKPGHGAIIVLVNGQEEAYWELSFVKVEPKEETPA
jgi:hypothetical protein